MLLNNSNGKPVRRDGTFTTDTGTLLVMDAANDRVVCDTQDLTHLECWVNQLVDAGTCTILVQKSIDGVNWVTIATLTEASFAAGNNLAVVTTLSDSNAMPVHAMQIRATLTAVAGGGTYSMSVFGRQLDMYR